MSTYIQILYQIVFSTKHRDPTLEAGRRKGLYKFIWSILRKKNCHLYAIGGVEDHIYIATHLHTSIALAHLVKDSKLASASYSKERTVFLRFAGWQDGYGAFTYSIDAKERLIAYVKGQEEHHRKISFLDEYKALLQEHQIVFDERYLL